MDPPPLPFSATDRCPYVDIWSLAFPPGSAAARADFILTDCPPNTQLEALLNTQESMPPHSRNLAHPALVSAVRSGVPINLKLRFWSLVVSSRPSTSAPVMTYEEASSDSAQGSVSTIIFETIDKDLDRTFPQWQAFKRAEGRLALRRVLCAVAASVPTVGYCQGINFIAGVLLLASSFNEPASYSVLCHLLLHPLLNYHTSSMSGFTVHVTALKMIVKRLMPDVHNCLFKHGLDLAVITPSWLLTMFATTSPPAMALRIIDSCLLEGHHVLLRVVLATLSAIVPPASVLARAARRAEDDDLSPPHLLAFDDVVGSSGESAVISPVLKDFSVSDDEDVVVISSKWQDDNGTRARAGALATFYICHTKTGLYVRPENEKIVKGSRLSLQLGPPSPFGIFSMREDGGLLHVKSGMVVALQAPPISGVQLILSSPLESPLQLCAKFSHDAAGCLLHHASGLFVHPKTGKGKEGIPLMLHPDPPARAFPGETEFSFLPVSASVAGTKEGSAVICPHVPGSPLLAEWEVPVFASLAGDDNIDGDSYEVGRVYSFLITGISLESSSDPEPEWHGAVAATASGEAFSIDEALHNPPQQEPASERGRASVLTPMMDKTEAFIGDALKALRSGATDFSSCCWGGGSSGTDSYSARSLVAVAAVHCGLVQPGEQQCVYVTVLPGENEYIGSNCNRIITGTLPSSSSSSSFKGYRLSLRVPPVIFCETTSAIPLRTLNYGSFYVLPLSQQPHLGNKHSHGGDGSSAGAYTRCTPFAVAALHSGAEAAAAAAAAGIPVTLPPCIVIKPAPGVRSYTGCTRHGVTTMDHTGEGIDTGYTVAALDSTWVKHPTAAHASGEPRLPNLEFYSGVNAALVDAGVCAMIVNKALWDWPCILPDTTIDKACSAAQDALDAQKKKNGWRGEVNLHFEDISGMGLAFRQAACVCALSRQVHAVLCSSTLRHLRAKSLPRHDTLVDQGASLLAHSHQLLLDIADQLPRNSPTHACLMKEVSLLRLHFSICGQDSSSSSNRSSYDGTIEAQVFDDVCILKWLLSSTLTASSMLSRLSDALPSPIIDVLSSAAATSLHLQELITTAIDRAPRCLYAAKVVDKLDDLCLQRSRSAGSHIGSLFTGSLVVLAHGVIDVISHSNVSMAPAPETLPLSVLEGAFLSLDQLIAENHQSRFLDIMPKGIAGYLQKGFFDLRSCIQRRRNDYIKHHLPGVSLSDADALHKSASEEWSASGASQPAPHVLSSCVPGLDMSDHALGVAAAMLFANLQVCSALCLDITAELPLPPPPQPSHASSQGGSSAHSLEHKWNGKYPACGAAALADQSLEVAIVGVVLALREALDWVRDSILSKRVLRKLKHMVVNTPAEQRVVSIQEFFESFLGNFMKEEREAAEIILHNVLDMQGLDGSPKGLFAGPEDNVMH